MDSISHQSESLVIVYCGNLSPKTSVAELIALFSQTAPIVKICLKKKENKEISSAFITFQSIEDAQKVIDKYNYYTIHNSQMRLSFYWPKESIRSDANLIIKNIPKDATSKDIYEIFKPFGNIISCKSDVDTGKEFKGCAFVQFADVKSADKAVESLKNYKIGDNILEISKFDVSFREKRQQEEEKRPVQFTNVYMKNFPSSMSEKKLREILEEYGPINSFYFPVDSDSKSKGTAFANFENPEHAANAIENLHQKLVFTPEEYPEDIVSPITFYIQKAEKKAERVEQIKKQLESMSMRESHGKTNLYVSNIPETFSKEEITELFSKFGKITSIKLQKTSSDSDKQYGYVCFSTPEEAAVAYEKIDGSILDDNKLTISYYKNRYERNSEPITPKNKYRNGDHSKHASGLSTSRLVQSLVNTVEKSASLYKKEWNAINVSNANEFSQKMAVEFMSLNESDLKEMIGSSTILENKVRSILKSKKDKTAQGFDNQ